MQHKNHEGMEQKKTPEYKTIEISAETYGKLCCTSKKLAEILRKKHVSHDQVIRLFYEVHPLEALIMEENI